MGWGRRSLEGGQVRGVYQGEASICNRGTACVGGGAMNSLVTLEQGREEAWGQVEDSGPEPLGVGATGCQQGVSPRLHVRGDHTSVTV